MSCPARLGAFAAVSLVLLRLATGWHFFQEGTNKLNDPNWTSAGFLLSAKGPLADFYHGKVPQVHDWRTLLAVPRDAGYIDQERLEEHRRWQEAYAKEIEAAREAGQPVPFKISQYKPYAQWADRIVADWQATLEQFFELPEIQEEEKDRGSEALADARQQLVNYLDTVEPEISEFQHEMFRIDQMEKRRVVGGPAYEDERIRTMEAEAAQMAQSWLAEVQAIEDDYHARLRAIFRMGQEAREAERVETAAAAEENEAAEEPAVADQPSEAQEAAVVADEPAAEETAAADSDGQDEPSVPLEGLPPSPEPAVPEESAPAEAPETAVAAESPEAAAAASADAEPREADAAAEASPESAAEAPAEESSEAAEAAEAASAAGETAEEERPTIQDVLTNRKQAELDYVDKIVTWSHVIIGACLIVGLFTPIAALAGAIFLAMVISTQPPWVPGTQDTYYQFVEMFGLLVLAATCAGRWAGLDYFFACLFGKCRRS